MSFYFEDVLLGIHRVKRPELPVGFGTTEIVQPMNFSQLMVLEQILSDLRGSSSLL